MKPVENAAQQAQELEGIVPTVNLAAEEGRKDFYGRAKTQHLAPLWRVLHGLVTATPATRCVPAIWHYKDVRPYLMEACKLIGAAEAGSSCAKRCRKRCCTWRLPSLPCG